MTKTRYNPTLVLPEMVAAVTRGAARHAEEHGRGMCVIYGHRTQQEQKRAHAAGYSKKNGVSSWSRHQYNPSPAVDCWPIVWGASEFVPLIWGRPPKGEARIVLSAKLKLTADLDLDHDGDSDARDVLEAFRRMAASVLSEPVILPLHPETGRLPAWRSTPVWGGSWSTDVSMRAIRSNSFIDGPHFQMADRDCWYLLQRKLLLTGYDPGPLDGLYGGKTRRALQAYAKSLGVRALGRGRGQKFRPGLEVWSALYWDSVS